MPITYCHGNLLDDDAEVLVNTVNVTGTRGPTMGKGLALSFAHRWPAIVAPYKAACLSGELRGGVCRLYDLPAGPEADLFAPVVRPRKWAAFCTKHDWRNGSEYRWIASGLSDLAALLAEANHSSVALPPLGCGNGGLDWTRVRPMIEEVFRESVVDVRIYGPVH
jgi:O-acetyl-ADP-ribose deacetylase (regulator of RNase III)